MLLPLLASALTQATWGLVFILITAIAVFTPWNRLRRKTPSVATSPAEPVLPAEPAVIPADAGTHLVNAIVEVEEEDEPIVEAVVIDDEEEEEEDDDDDDDRDYASVAADVHTKNNVIRIDITGPKPDGTFDSVPHHHH